MMKKVSILIVNWNGKKYLQKCLESVFDQSYKNFEVILVDNASTDGSESYVTKAYPQVKIIVNKSNLGFAEANNIGYRKATGDYILFLNNDTEVTRHFLKELVHVLDNNKSIGGVQSKILLMDDRSRLDSVGAFLTNTGFLYHYGIAKPDSEKYNKQISVYSAKGACMMFRKDVLDKILVNSELFDSQYFAYFEETDMCHRVWLAGYTIEFVPASIIYHKMGGTSTLLANPFVQYHSFKNRINSLIKNLGFAAIVKILPVHLFMCEIVGLIYLLQGKPAYFISINKALFWNLLTIFSTLQKRSYIQRSIRQAADKDLFSSIKKNVPIRYFYFLLKGLQHYED